MRHTRKHHVCQEKEIRRLKEENEFGEDVSAFSLPAVGSLQKAENDDVSCHKNGRRRYEGKISLYCVDDMSGHYCQHGYKPGNCWRSEKTDGYIR